LHYRFLGALVAVVEDVTGRDGVGRRSPKYQPKVLNVSLVIALSAWRELRQFLKEIAIEDCIERCSRVRAIRSAGERAVHFTRSGSEIMPFVHAIDVPIAAVLQVNTPRQMFVCVRLLPMVPC